MEGRVRKLEQRVAELEKKVAAGKTTDIQQINRTLKNALDNRNGIS